MLLIGHILAAVHPGYHHIQQLIGPYKMSRIGCVEKQMKCPVLEFYDGGDLQELHTQLINGATVFKDEMKSDYNMDGPTCTRFTAELRKLYI